LSMLKHFRDVTKPFARIDGLKLQLVQHGHLSCRLACEL
jgi:hypothetical protein